MPRIILLLLVLLFVYYLLLRYRKLDALKKKQFLNMFILAGLFCLLLLLALTGHLSWLIAAVGALLPLIPRGVRFFMGAWPSIKPYFQRYKQNRQSTMHTRFIHLRIDMLSGQLQGEVVEGEYAGQALGNLPVAKLLILLEQCQQQDAESAALLLAYLNRQHAGWDNGQAGSFKQKTTTDSEMTVQQAREVLGVSDAATEKEIIKTHKQLMQKLHPDRGGSDYLAQQINRARDVLLKNS